MLAAELQSSQTTMRCSGSRHCSCTKFRRKKSSPQCKNCSHGPDDHISSSDSDDGSDDSDSHTDKSPPTTKNKQTVSSLVSDILGGGEYTERGFKHAQSEARAGLTKRHVGQLARSHLVIPTYCIMTQYQMKPKLHHGFGTKPLKGDLPDIKSAARVLKIIMFPYRKKVCPS